MGVIIRADVVIGHIGDKPIGIASWIVFLWLIFIVVSILVGLFTN